jgi:tRNA (cytidine/uridine-2'-O-)-methyltransferase
LNLSNSVAIVLYEALRQNGFENMTKEGHLHRLEW